MFAGVVRTKCSKHVVIHLRNVFCVRRDLELDQQQESALDEERQVCSALIIYLTRLQTTNGGIAALPIVEGSPSSSTSVSPEDSLSECQRQSLHFVYTILISSCYIFSPLFKSYFRSCLGERSYTLARKSVSSLMLSWHLL